MLGFGKKNNPEDIKSAHEKQKKKFQGQGGIIFTEAEQDVIDNHIPLPGDDAEEPAEIPAENPVPEVPVETPAETPGAFSEVASVFGSEEGKQ